MKRRLLMLDLFAGLGGASQVMRERGWDVVTVDNNPDFKTDIVADLSSWSWDGPRPDLVWCSPPCEEFTRYRLPWIINALKPSLDLVRSSLRIIEESEPVFYALENVRGAVPFIDPIMGRIKFSAGPFFIWTDLPRMKINIPPFKEMLSSTQRAERAYVPAALSSAVATAVESSFFVRSPGCLI